MRFFVAFVVSALAAIVSCQSSGPNAFNIPPAGNYLLHAGQPTTFTWSNLSGSTVTLTLRDGPNGDLNPGTVIQANVPNTGTYTYTPPTDIVAGNTYTIEISNDQDPTQTNYTPQFDIISNNQPVPSSASASGSTTMTMTSSGTTSTMTGSMSSSMSGSMTTTTSSGSMPSTTGTASTSSGGSSTASGAAAATTTSAPKGNGAIIVTAGAAGLLAIAAAMVAVM
ncbi:Mucin-21 [Ptychographa xylographoides]|nr:Mucin-21 [Ptychographa xylographoides]